jgi:AAA15 family ATPase/GTPase
MKRFVEYLHISNFKSIRDLKLEGCRRINLFVGYPNVGKSNVLEAMSLFCVPFLTPGENLNRFIRAENKNEIFHNASDRCCYVITNLEGVQLEEMPFLIATIFHYMGHYNMLFKFSQNLKLEYARPPTFDEEVAVAERTEIKRYIFQPKQQWKSTGDELLLPPFGENIIDTLSYSKNVADVKTWMKKEFAKYGLEYILDKSSSSIKVQQRLGGDEVFQLPYSSIADTLQRTIFYKTAIASNRDSILLFEEPEAHAFPPYIKTITQDIIGSADNQYFIVTHSPIILNDFMECADLRKELAIYLFDFKDGQTVAKRMSDAEVDEVYSYGEDLFFNIEKFL